MDWDDLRVFADLARSGSLSATARTLKIDHTTVGRRLAALEAAFGVRLFDRLSRGTVLTADGERIAEAVARMEEQAFTVERLASGSGLTGSVRVSAPPNFATCFLAPRLAELRRRHPGIVLELMGDTRSVSLARREADIAIRLTRPQGDSLVGRRLGVMSFRLYAARGSVEQQDRADWDYVGFDDSLDHIPQQVWLRQLAGGKPPVFRSNEQSILLAAIKAGVGVGVVPCFLAENDPGLVALEVGPPPAPRELWLVVHDDLRHSPRVRAVIDFLAETVASEARLLEGMAVSR